MSLSDTALQQWSPTSPDEARALAAAVLAAAAARGVVLPSVPAAPDNCCGNGCIECVWAGHYAELAWWRDDALQRWAA